MSQRLRLNLIRDWPRQKGRLTESFTKIKRYFVCCQVKLLKKILTVRTICRLNRKRSDEMYVWWLWIHKAYQGFKVDMIISFKVKMITSPPFRTKQLRGDLTMAEYQFQGGFLQYSGYDWRIHATTWSTLARHTRTYISLGAWLSNSKSKAMTSMLHLTHLILSHS